MESCPNTTTIRNKSPIQMMNLRPREPEKELAGQFRFKPRTTNDRVFESLIKYHGSSKNFVNASPRKSRSPNKR